MAMLATAQEAGTAEATESTVTGRTYADDLRVVRSILDANGMSGISETEVSVEQDGRMVQLDLTNKDLESFGMRKLPAEIGKLDALKKLVLAHNSIKLLPEKIGNLRKLEILDAGHNEIEAVPASIGKLTNLRKLDLRRNEISSLPAELYTLPNLWYLHLWGNELTSISPKIGNLKSIKELYLKGNELKSLPLVLTRKKSLTYIDYSDNKICNPEGKLKAWLIKRDKRWREFQLCH
jgi:hypothetical protein